VADGLLQPAWTLGSSDAGPIGTVQAKRLGGEDVGNSFAVDETGAVFIVTDHALSRFEAGPGGRPVITWRKRYDRGTRLKRGQANFGSGTTPALFGRTPGRRFVAITDNADPRMHVSCTGAVETWRDDGSCAGERSSPGAAENSLIYVAHSLIVENNYGYTGPTSTENGRVTAPGISRVLLRRGGGCRVAWTSHERVPSTVSKASRGTGLIYTYTKDRNRKGEDGWYFTAIDVRFGRTVFERLAGYNLGYNNNFAPVSLHPDARTAYVGALGGLIEFRDRPR
jgi:hypothetical protein